MNKLFFILPVLIGGIFFLRSKTAIANQELDTVDTKHNGLNYPASNIDFNKINGFTVDEFQGQLHLLDAQVIYTLATLRSLIGRIRISPAPGAVARTQGSESTMHFAGNGRLSLAVDIMPLDVDLKTAYQAAKSISQIGAVGVYPDWNPQAGLHIDLRKRKAAFKIAEWSGLKINGSQVYRGVGEAFV